MASNDEQMNDEQEANVDKETEELPSREKSETKSERRRGRDKRRSITNRFKSKMIAEKYNVNGCLHG